MPTLSSLRAFAPVFLLTLSGCPAAGPAEKPPSPAPTASEKEPAGARMKRAEAIRLARKTFERKFRGHDPATWSEENLDVRFVSLEGRAAWIASLPNLVSDSHGGPSVYIDDETGKANLKLGK